MTHLLTTTWKCPDKSDDRFDAVAAQPFVAVESCRDGQVTEAFAEEDSVFNAQRGALGADGETAWTAAPASTVWPRCQVGT